MFSCRLIASISQIRKTTLRSEIAKDGTLMQYAVKGTEEQWSQVLDGKGLAETGTVQIRSVREKRKNLDEDDYQKEAASERGMKKSKNKKKNKKNNQK